MWGTCIDPADDALHLLELIHQIRLCMKTSGCVREKYINAASSRCLHRIECNGSRISAGGLRNDADIIALTPNLQLLDSRCAECIARSEHDFESSVFEMSCELADR